ncbi:acyltransferase, partial [bacterium]|nr:acyltransferase [bacterium]
VDWNNKLLRNFIYIETTLGKKHLKINLFGIKLSFNISLKKHTNNIYLKTADGKLKKIKKIKGLKVIFKNSDSTVIINEPAIKFGTSKIILGKNCLFEIGAKTKDELTKVSRVNFTMGKNSKIIIGDNLFFGGGHVALNENSSLTIGNDCLFSYGLNFMIGEAHSLINSKTQENIPITGNVVIGDRVWIGMNSTILKNAQLGNDIIVGTCSVVSKKFDTPNIAIAGNPARIIKENISWKK